MGGIVFGVIGLFGSLTWLSGWDGGPKDMIIGGFGLVVSLLCIFLGYKTR